MQSKCVGSEDEQYPASYDAEEQNTNKNSDHTATGIENCFKIKFS